MPVLVNGVEITDEQVFSEMQYHPAKSQEDALQLAAKALTIRELLLQDAIEKGFAERNESSETEPEADDARIEKLLLEVIKIPESDEDSCRRFYDNNHQKFTHDGEVAPFEKVSTVIAEYLRDASWQTAVGQYIKILAGKAKIAGIQLDSTDSPLVQ